MLENIPCFPHVIIKRFLGTYHAFSLSTHSASAARAAKRRALSQASFLAGPYETHLPVVPKQPLAIQSITGVGLLRAHLNATPKEVLYAYPFPGHFILVDGLCARRL